MKRKAFIGLAPTIIEEKDDNPFTKKYEYINTYLETIIANKAIPICLNYQNDNIVEEQAALCDAFILPGNCLIRSQIFKLIDYAYKNNKPVLGICLGMQELAIFSFLNSKSIDNLKTQKRLENNILKRVNNHHQITAHRKQMSKAKHRIYLQKDSLLFSIYKRKEISVYSFHDYQVTNVNNSFFIAAKSNDGVIEVIESNFKPKMIGVQFHPELEKNNKLIKYFINNINNNKR